jgi:hypothetical protein
MDFISFDDKIDLGDQIRNFRPKLDGKKNGTLSSSS